MSKRQWSGIQVRAFLAFQPNPPCFEPHQWAAWKQCAHDASLGVGNNGGIGTIDLPPHCSDCTRSFQSSMRAEGRCTHPEVKFLEGRAYIDPATQRID